MRWQPLPGPTHVSILLIPFRLPSQASAVCHQQHLRQVVITLGIQTGDVLNALEPRVDRVGMHMQCARRSLDVHVGVCKSAQCLHKLALGLFVSVAESGKPQRKRRPDVLDTPINQQASNRQRIKRNDALADSCEVERHRGLMQGPRNQ